MIQIHSKLWQTLLQTLDFRIYYFYSKALKDQKGCLGKYNHIGSQELQTQVKVLIVEFCKWLYCLSAEFKPPTFTCLQLSLNSLFFSSAIDSFKAGGSQFIRKKMYLFLAYILKLTLKA